MNHSIDDKSAPGILRALDGLRIETPSWGYANTGTRFGKFHQESAAIDLFDKLADAGQVHRVTGCCPSVAVHVLWDFPEGVEIARIKEAARECGVEIGSVNPNLFQDQKYKLGSFANPDSQIRDRAVRHCCEAIELAGRLGSKIISLWFADGTNYPGQDSLRGRKHRFEEGLQACYSALSGDQHLLIEYKPFEPAFYHTDIADWGMAHLFAARLGPKAKVLVDTGHHYAAQNVEQIVAWLLDEGKLGGFHFNDRRYADDDLTLGSIDPYQVFRIFCEIHSFAFESGGAALDLAYMVDQSHNLKPKLEAMIQTVMVAQDLFAKAATVPYGLLERCRNRGAIVDAERLLQQAFFSDVNPVLTSWRKHRGLAADPLEAFRSSGYLENTLRDRRERRKELGRANPSSYA